MNANLVILGTVITLMSVVIAMYTQKLSKRMDVKNIIISLIINISALSIYSTYVIMKYGFITFIKMSIITSITSTLLFNTISKENRRNTKIFINAVKYKIFSR